MRIVFMGTPDFSVPALEALVHAGHDVAAVYTQPPRRAGRGKSVQKTPVHRKADSLGINVFTPENFRSLESRAAFDAVGADVAVVVAYGLILPQAILDMPRLGCLNIHASLLPRWRGAAPILRAIQAGDPETGVGIMQMEKGLDTGPVWAETRTDIAAHETAETLHDRLSAMGAALLVDTLPKIASSTSTPVPQRADGISYAHKIDKAEARIDWTQDSVTVDRHIRAFCPFPGAYTEIGGERVKILGGDRVDLTDRADRPGFVPGQVIDDQLTIACGRGAFRPTRLQRAGKGAMDLHAFLRGFAVHSGLIVP